MSKKLIIVLFLVNIVFYSISSIGGIYLYNAINTYNHYSNNASFGLLTKAIWDMYAVQIQNFQRLSNNTVVPLDGRITYPNLPSIISYFYFFMVMVLIVELYREKNKHKN